MGRRNRAGREAACVLKELIGGNVALYVRRNVSPDRAAGRGLDLTKVTSNGSGPEADKRDSTAQGVKAVAAGPRRAGEVADQTVQDNGWSISLPLVGNVLLPPPDHLAWYLGVGALSVLEMIDWPVAAVLVVGRLLADNRRNKMLAEFGEALETL